MKKIFIFKPAEIWRYCGGGRVVGEPIKNVSELAQKALKDFGKTFKDLADFDKR